MTDTVTRRYVAILRRQWWLVLQAAIVVGVVAGLLAGRGGTSADQARAQLYVEPGVAPDGSLPLVSQPSSFGSSTPPISPVLAAALTRQASSRAVLEGAAKALSGSATRALGGEFSTSVDAANRSITITARSSSGAGATKLANAVAQSLVDTRWAQRNSVLQSQMSAIRSQLGEIQRNIDRLNTQETEAKANNSDTSSFEAARTVWYSQYSAQFSNQQQLQSSLLTHDSGVQFLLPAQGSSNIGVRKIWSLALTGAAIGLVIGIGLALLREALDTRIHDREDAEVVSSLETLAELPEDRALRRRPLAVVDAPRSRYAEAVRGLRSTFMWALDKSGPTSIAFTSAEPDDGRTTISMNLAASFALAGVTTILVSADFQDPSSDLTSILGADVSARALHLGLAELLVDQGVDVLDRPGFDAALVSTRVPHLRWLPVAASMSSDALAMEASELMSSARMRKLLVVLAGMAELVVVDTGPAVLSDSLQINGLVDGTLLVVRIGSSHRGALERAARALKGTPAMPLGLVLNRTHPPRDELLTPQLRRRRRARPAETSGVARRTTAENT